MEAPGWLCVSSSSSLGVSGHWVDADHKSFLLVYGFDSVARTQDSRSKLAPVVDASGTAAFQKMRSVVPFGAKLGEGATLHWNTPVPFLQTGRYLSSNWASCWSFATSFMRHSQMRTLWERHTALVHHQPQVQFISSGLEPLNVSMEGTKNESPELLICSMLRSTEWW